ncbi:hypothetical protein ABT354_12465 [Streptomyces sp. NPDC000594]|uniref:hypothetical protein n=1 Tax=Streptomyces sp. NPDC000594 TaxID=3154261 RepID=UPI00331BF2D2
MAIPGYERRRPGPPSSTGDRLVPQLESFCAMECRAECTFAHGHDHSKPKWQRCYADCMKDCF